MGGDNNYFQFRFLPQLKLTMAAAVSWRNKLNSHPLAQILRQNNTGNSGQNPHVDAKSLVCVHGCDLYVWDSGAGHLVHCNLKSLADIGEEENAGAGGRSPHTNTDGVSTSQTQTSKKFQKLLVTAEFNNDVEGITMNGCGSHMLVWGKQDVKILELPRRWGKNALFEGGPDTVTCRTVSIGERQFSKGHHLHVRQVSWHPGSEADTHIALLTSDNIFSVYDIQQPDHPISIIKISVGDESASQSFGTSVMATALGETGVAFDFGPPVVLQPKLKLVQGTKEACPIEIWPVYCVKGNGDVMLVYSHLSEFRGLKLPVQGPLVMFPPAEDNYGVDACSILCLPAPFPVLVISTFVGRVHHCVQLPNASDESGQTDETFNSNIGSSNDTIVCGSHLYQPMPEPVLYVIESAELELCLSLPRAEDDTLTEDDFMCPIRLQKDATCYDRYYCSHAAGIHMVALPWLSVVEQYFLESSGDLSMPERKECVVEHLLCTKPLHSSPTCAVQGVDIVSSPVLGPTLLALSSDFEFTGIPIGVHYRLGCIQRSDNTPTGNQITSPQRQQTREPFSKQIEQILHKKTSNPLFKCSSSSNLSQQDCFHLLIRTTQILREEYIQRQIQARQELDTRINTRRELKKHHLHDLQQLMNSKHSLREHAHTIAERLETCKDNHENLVKRLESILRKIQSKVPVLSEAERQMASELARLGDNVHLYANNIEQIRVKQQYQEKQIIRSSSTGAPSLNNKQLTQIHDVLKDEGQDIEALISDVNKLTVASS